MGGATRTIGVPVGAATIAALRTNGATLFNVLLDAAQQLNGDQRLEPDDAFASLSLENVLIVAPPTGSPPTDPEAASLRQLQQVAAGDRSIISADLADRWVPQLSSKRPGVVDDGLVWNNTLTMQEHLRLRQDYGAKLVWSGDWSSFSTPDFWVTIAPIAFDDPDSALQWCTAEGFDSWHCAAKLVSTTHPFAGSFAHN